MQNSLSYKLNACRNARSPARRGATVVECAITLPIMLFVLFALLDLGIAATRYNALADVSRRIARSAILHGALAPQASGTWGPQSFTGTLADNSPIVTPAQGMAPTMQAGDVTIQVTWLDNDNSPGDRVQVQIDYRHVPLIPGICVWGPINLRSVAIMRVVN